MKIVRQFRKKGDGDLKVTYHEDISKAATNPVFVGWLAVCLHRRMSLRVGCAD